MNQDIKRWANVSNVLNRWIPHDPNALDPTRWLQDNADKINGIHLRDIRGRWDHSSNVMGVRNEIVVDAVLKQTEQIRYEIVEQE